MRRIGIFLRSVALPVCVALLLAILFRPIYLSEGQPNYLLAWICIGFPFGMFKQVADVQTSDMLQLPVPETVYEDVVLEPSEEQREMVSALGERAEQVRNRLVEPKEDNMLKITSDGRKLALDQRLMNDMLPDDTNSKVNACVERVFSIWDEGKAERTTQLLFCDLSTPKGDGTFNVYDDIREKLVAKGVPREEICFIHEADTEAKKIALFARMRSGEARVLIGSSAKCGAGMNIQDRLIALHHLDVPWRPSEEEQTLRYIFRLIITVISQ